MPVRSCGDINPHAAHTTDMGAWGVRRCLGVLAPTDEVDVSALSAPKGPAPGAPVEATLKTFGLTPDQEIRRVALGCAVKVSLDSVSVPVFSPDGVAVAIAERAGHALAIAAEFESFIRDGRREDEPQP